MIQTLTHINTPKNCFDFQISVCFSKCDANICLCRSGQITGIALGVPAGLIFCLVLFFLGMLYHRGLAIRRKRAMRRYLESGEVRPWTKPASRVTPAFLFIWEMYNWQSFEPLGPGEKGTKVHARILRPSDLRKIKPLGSGVFGTVSKVLIKCSFTDSFHLM